MSPDLRGDVELDLDSLRRELDETATHRAEILSHPTDDPPDGWDRRAAGALLHQCYTGMENALKRIAIGVDGSAPGGAASHTDLLKQVSTPGARRGPVVSAELLTDRRELLGFRHVARSHYGHEYDWDRLKPLLDRLPGVAERFTAEVRAFMEVPRK